MWPKRRSCSQTEIGLWGGHCSIPVPKEEMGLWGGYCGIPIPKEKTGICCGHRGLIPPSMLPLWSRSCGSSVQTSLGIVNSLFSSHTKPGSAAVASRLFPGCSTSVPGLSWEFSAPVTSSHSDRFCDTSPKNPSPAGPRWHRLNPAGS